MIDDRGSEEAIAEAGRDIRRIPPIAERVMRRVVCDSPLTTPHLEKKGVLKMILGTKYAAAAAAVLLVAASLCVMTLTGGESTIAYAQVREHLESAKTVSYTQTVPLASGQILRTRLMSKGSDLLRMEITPLRPDGKPYYPAGPSTIMIADSRLGKMLALYPETKKATVQSFGKLRPNSRRVGMTFDHVKALLKGKDKPLGERKIDGRSARGFQVTSGSKAIEIWVDAATGDPLLFVIPTSQGDATIRDIELDGPLDDSLFSVEAPKGYVVERIEPEKQNDSSQRRKPALPARPG